eukprot:211171_1
MKTVLNYDVIRPKGISIKLPVIILHGFFGCKSNLRHIVNSPLIHTDRTCYLLDLRNHGDSFHKQDMQYKSMTEDVIEFMKMVGITKSAIWIGHSYGAKIGYYAALKYSQYVSSVIALDMAPKTYESRKQQFHENLLLLKSMDSMKWKNRKQIEHFLSSKLPTLQPMEIKFLTKPFVPMDEHMDHNIEREWYWKTNIDAMINEMDNIVAFPVDSNAKYTGPSYLLRGASSNWADVNCEEKIYDKFPNIKITTVENSGHLLHVEQPDEVVKHISNALNEIDIDFNKSHGGVWDELLARQKSGEEEEFVC